MENDHTELRAGVRLEDEEPEPRWGWASPKKMVILSAGDATSQEKSSGNTVRYMHSLCGIV